MSRLPEEVAEYIRSHLGIKKIRSLAEDVDALYSEKYGRHFTYSGVKSYITNHHLHNNCPTSYAKVKKFSDEQIEFVRQNAKGIYNADMARMVNERFGTSYTTQEVRAMKKREHIDSGLTGQYEKSNIPWSKGRKMVYKKPRTGLFTKGNIPWNRRNLGDTRVDSNTGYELVKTEQGYVGLSRYVYEQAHGKLPKGMVVIHLDGDRLNHSLDNLMAVKTSTHARLTGFGMRLENPEATRAAVTLVDLMGEINAREKRSQRFHGKGRKKNGQEKI